MKPKTTIITFLITWLTFAVISVGFDYFDGSGFSLWKLIFKATVFSFFMVLWFRYNLKKRNEVASVDKQKM